MRSDSVFGFSCASRSGFFLPSVVSDIDVLRRIFLTRFDLHHTRAQPTVLRSLFRSELFCHSKGQGGRRPVGNALQRSPMSANMARRIGSGRDAHTSTTRAGSGQQRPAPLSAPPVLRTVVSLADLAKVRFRYTPARLVSLVFSALQKPRLRRPSLRPNVHGVSAPGRRTRRRQG